MSRRQDPPVVQQDWSLRCQAFSPAGAHLQHAANALEHRHAGFCLVVAQPGEVSGQVGHRRRRPGIADLHDQVGRLGTAPDGAQQPGRERQAPQVQQVHLAVPLAGLDRARVLRAGGLERQEAVEPGALRIGGGDHAGVEGVLVDNHRAWQLRRLWPGLLQIEQRDLPGFTGAEQSWQRLAAL